MTASSTNLNELLADHQISLNEQLTELAIPDLPLRYNLVYITTLLNPESFARHFRNSEVWNVADGVALFRSSTPRGRELMRAAGRAYLTEDGHLFVRDPTNRAFLLLERPLPVARSASTGGEYTKNDLKVLFAWLVQAPTEAGSSQVQLARYAGVSEASVTRALDKLKANGFPKDRERLHVEETIALLQTWSEQYALRLKPKLRARRYRPFELPKDWRQLPLLPAGITYSGDAAAAVEGYDLLAGEAVEVYGSIDEVQSNLRSYRWIPDPNGRLVVRDRFWGQATPEWSVTGQSSHLTIPLLTYADLMATQDPRAKVVAEDVLDTCLQLYRR